MEQNNESQTPQTPQTPPPFPANGLHHPPMPPMAPIPPKKKNSAKSYIIAGAVLFLALAGWFTCSYFYGPSSEIGMAHKVEMLRKDSVELQKDWRPKGRYTFVQDVASDYNKIKDLGNPARTAGTDSATVFSKPQTAEIARYNVAKCDSVLSDVGPLWRVTASMVLSDMLRSINRNTIVRTNDEQGRYSGIEIYSIRYLSDKEMKKDAQEYNYYLKQLGFKTALYAPDPDSEGTVYTFAK